MILNFMALLVKWGGLVAICYFGKEGLEALAGKKTEAIGQLDLALFDVVSVREAIFVGLIVCLAGWGLLESPSGATGCLPRTYRD